LATNKNIPKKNIGPLQMHMRQNVLMGRASESGQERDTHSQQEELQFPGTLISDSRTLLLLAAQAGTQSFRLQFPHQNISLVHYVALSGAGHARSLARSLTHSQESALSCTKLLTCNSSNCLFIFGL